MLVLRRRLGERIMIGKDIVVTLCEVGRGFARLGIEAPQSIKVLRDDCKSDEPKKRGEEHGQQALPDA